MAHKTVSGARTADIQLDGSVSTVNFGYSYNYYAVRNDSDKTIYVSTTDKSCTPGNDGVVSIPTGGGYVHYNGFGGSAEIYISGTGGALVIAQDDGVCPFKVRSKGGDDFAVIVGTKYEGTNVMPQTLVKIDEYTIGSDVIKLIAENWGMPFEDDADNDNAGRIWLDKDKNIYLYCEAVKDSRYTWFTISIRLCYDTTITDDLFKLAVGIQGAQTTYLYMDRNPNGTVLYIRTWYSTQSLALIMAKEQNGDWVCFGGDRIITKNEVVMLGTTSVTPNYRLMYSAFAMPNVIDGKQFDGLYKMYTTPAAATNNLYFSVNDKPFRGVSTLSGTSTALNPNYAFEARQKQRRYNIC